MSRLVERALAGEAIRIARARRRVGQWVPCPRREKAPALGGDRWWRGRVLGDRLDKSGRRIRRAIMAGGTGRAALAASADDRGGRPPVTPTAVLQGLLCAQQQRPPRLPRERIVFPHRRIEALSQEMAGRESEEEDARTRLQAIGGGRPAIASRPPHRRHPDHESREGDPAGSFGRGSRLLGRQQSAENPERERRPGSPRRPRQPGRLHGLAACGPTRGETRCYPGAMHHRRVGRARGRTS